MKMNVVNANGNRTSSGPRGPDLDVPRICGGLIAQENSSKTITLRSGLTQAVKTPSPAGFSLMPTDIHGAAELQARFNETIEQIQGGFHLSTQAPEDWRLQLINGHKRLAKLTITDPIGQLISQVLRDSPDLARQRLADQLTNFRRADVLVAQILCPVRGKVSAFRDAQFFATNALIHAIQKRSPGQPPAALLIHLAGIDVQAGSEGSLRHSLSLNLVREAFRPLMEVAGRSDRVGDVGLRLWLCRRGAPGRPGVLEVGSRDAAGSVQRPPVALEGHHGVDPGLAPFWDPNGRAGRSTTTVSGEPVCRPKRNARLLSDLENS
jgi:hypothetical protein